MDKNPGKSIVWNPLLWITLAVLLIYARTTGFDLLNYDEQYLIVENKAFLADPLSLIKAFLQPVGSHFEHFYRPALMLSLIANAQILGFYPFWFHVGNVLLHLAAVLLLYVMLKRLKCGDTRAFVCSIIFAVHPILTQAVAWVPGRNDSLLGIGVFASFLMLIDYSERRKTLSYALHLIALFFALLTKETAISVFPVFAFYIFLVDPNMRASERKKLLAGWAVTAAVYAFLYLNAVKYDHVFYQRVFTHAYLMPAAFLNYLGKMLFPFNLSGFPYIGDVSWLAGIPAALVIGLAVYLARQRRAALVWFGAAWTVLFLLPSLLLGWQGVQFEHRAYVPIAGLFIIAGGLRGGIIDRLTSTYRGALIAAIAVIIAVFSVISVRYGEIFADNGRFWTDAAARSPNSYLAYKNLGVTLGQAGKFGEAFEAFKRSLELNGGDKETHLFAGNSLVMLGRKDEAVQEYRKALKIDPEYDEARRKIEWLAEN